MNLDKFKFKFNKMKMKDIEKALDDIDFEKLPEGLKISYRRINETLMEKDKTANKVYDVCKEVYEKLSKKQ